MARAGLVDATGDDPRRRRPGLMNLFTYGRSVTLAIQTIKSFDPAFEEWWSPYQEWMKADPLMTYFNDTRTDIVHEGELATSNYTQIGVDGPVDIGRLMGDLQRSAPPNTIRTFLGDRLGGNGWEVRMPDGSVEKVYFNLPADSGVVSGMTLMDPPDQHDGQPLADTSIASVGGLYISALSRIVAEFTARYSE